MKILDTNILYYKYRSFKYPTNIDRQYITSISALEFLKNIDKDYNNRAKYYIPLPNNIIHKATFLERKSGARNRPYNKRLTDGIKFSFNQSFDDFIIYNNLAIEEVINTQNYDIFKSSIEFLPKELYKEIKDKFKFLLDSELLCLSIDSQDIELSYFLLDLFLSKNTIKEDFKNSWNDILILAKTINIKSKLITEDKLLNRFASEILKGKISSLDNNEIEIDFTTEESTQQRNKLESKGYINRGWDYKIRKQSQNHL